MKNFRGAQSKIHFVARGFLVQGDLVVLCRANGTQHYFLPGGHIEDGEGARTALIRELGEELGCSDYRVGNLIGVCENIFKPLEGVDQHEINLVFEVSVPEDLKIASQEEHLEFITVPQSDLRSYKVLPGALKDGLIDWLEKGQTFFKEISE